MTPIHSFPPIKPATPRVLVLGTMPGKASLRASQYYAHPRNTFWQILGQVLGFDAALSYEARVQAVAVRGVAVWDVLQLCTRESSLDSDIDEGSIVPNDFEAFFTSAPTVERVCFNGAKAAEFYRKHVLPGLGQRWRALSLIRLPSTSPANAAVPYQRKLEAWSEALALQ